jgi:hypothetical protein
MRMRHIAFYLLCAVAVQSWCCADVTKLPAEDRKVLQDSSRFHEVHSTSDLPPAIVTVCGGKLADPDQKWNATDVIMDTTLPGKRLIWAAVGGDYYVVHYERGGIAHTFHVLVPTLAKDEAKPKWFGAPLEVRSKTTQRFSTRCELANWTIAWITADGGGQHHPRSD